ncbi:unnamed protein product [Callosobruchus maculatus]|nr:unnamed protein product [Callosobruchus maculatus]
MFFFDLLALAVVASTFPVFSEYEPKDTVWTYLSTSVIPVRYVSVVLVHCINILVDRAIYLQKSLVLKLVYHVLQFLSVHIWLFVMIPHFISGRMTFTEYESVKKVYNAYDISKEFLDNYVNTDVAALTFRTGGATWMIRQQELRKMIRIIHGAHPVPVVMTCDIILPGDNNKELSLSVRKMMFPYSFTRQSMAKLMIGEKVEKPVTIEYLLPKFLKIEQRGKVSMVNLLMHPEGTEDAGTRQRNITFKSILATDGNGRVWWDLSEEIDDENFSKFLGKIPYASGSDGNMAIITFSDKVVHSFFSMVTGGSIITFYSLFLFIIHGWSRDLISFRMGRIWLYEVPQADVLYALCKEVYICREANMWELEEVAAARVFFMIRSGDTALKLSRFHGSPYNPNTNKTMPPVTRRS